MLDHNRAWFYCSPSSRQPQDVECPETSLLRPPMYATVWHTAGYSGRWTLSVRGLWSEEDVCRNTILERFDWIELTFIVCEQLKGDKTTFAESEIRVVPVGESPQISVLEAVFWQNTLMRSAEENSLQPAGDPSDASVKKVGEPWKGLSEPEDLPGVDDLLGSFRWYDALCS